jgi:hypothetical protein
MDSPVNASSDTTPTKRAPARAAVQWRMLGSRLDSVYRYHDLQGESARGPGLGGLRDASRRWPLQVTPEKPR